MIKQTIDHKPLTTGFLMRNRSMIDGLWPMVLILFCASFFASRVFAAAGVIEGPVDNQESYTRHAAEQRSLSAEDFPGLKKKISVDLRGMEIVDVFKFLAVEGSINIAIARDVVGTVNLLINDVTIEDIFEILLSTNNLAYQVQGNVITVISNQEYKALQGVDFHDQRETVIYQLKYASAQNAGTLLGNVKSDIGKIIYDDSTGMLVLIDTPSKIKEMDVIVKKTDISTITRELPTQTRIFELGYAKVEDILAEVQAALTPNVGTIRKDTRTNTIVVTDLPHKLKEVETIIGAFDRRTRQVFIEAKIVQVTLSDEFKWGIDWDRVFAGAQAGNLQGMSITPKTNMDVGFSEDANVGRLTIARTGTNSLNFVLEALSAVGETQILSNPHIAVEEGKEATINVVKKQPYSETTTTTTDAATTESTEFTFVDVGVKLNVTPTINKDGFINMLIKPESSAVVDTFGDGADEVPVVETANAESTVLVKDGTTVIIAGMIKDTKSKAVNKVPLIGDVPVIGKIFSNVSDRIERNETIVFLTPRIISGEESFLMERHLPKAIKGIRK